VCTLVILRRPGHDWPLLLAANRDELHHRHAEPPARHWPNRPQVIAGLDRAGGGSWLGLNDQALVAAVMDWKGSLGPAPGKRSRGELVPEALDPPRPKRRPAPWPISTPMPTAPSTSWWPTPGTPTSCGTGAMGRSGCIRFPPDCTCSAPPSWTITATHASATICRVSGPPEHPSRSRAARTNGGTCWRAGPVHRRRTPVQP